MLFLFPSDYFNFKLVDEMYRSELQSLQEAGFATATISIESLATRSPKVHPVISPNIDVIYRGWMLNPGEYGLLSDAIERMGAKVYTAPITYLATHYLPNWYHLLTDFTPETKFYSLADDLEAELTKLGWEKFFIKDYVKSLKTSVGAILSHPAEIQTVIAQMQKFRGSIEGGICVRQVEDFIATTERRYFIINGKSFAADRAIPIPDLVIECARRIDSKFFSIDTIERRDGVLRVVEIGDGQVSGLVGWTPERFAEIWREQSE
jgi:ATP-grasp domain, R2K clade family 3